MSRTERRAAQQTRAEPPVIEQPLLAPHNAFGIAHLMANPMRWVAVRISSDGSTEVLTPLYDGKLRGESKWAATARMKRAEQADVAGLGRRGAA